VIRRPRSCSRGGVGVGVGEVNGSPGVDEHIGPGQLRLGVVGPWRCGGTAGTEGLVVCGVCDATGIPLSDEEWT